MVLSPQLWDTFFISEVNGARKVKSDAQNSDPVQNIFLRSGWGQAPNSKFSKLLELLEKSLASKFIFGLQININKVNSRKYDVIPVDGIARSAPTVNFSTVLPVYL